MKPLYEIKSVKMRYFLYLLICFTICTFGITGCIPNAYTKEERNEQIEVGKTILNEYLEESYEGATIEKIDVLDAVASSKYQLTDYVEGTFAFGNENYRFVVNTVSKEIYTSAGYEDFVQSCMEKVVEETGLEYEGIACRYFSLDISVPALENDTEGIFEGETTDLKDVLPCGVDVDSYAEQVLGSDAYKIYMKINYCGTKQLEHYSDTLDNIKDIPGLSHVTLHHIREEDDLKKTAWQDSDNYEENQIDNTYEYMDLETLDLSNSNHKIEYRKWEEVSVEGFTFVYSSYIKMREQEMNESTGEYTDWKTVEEKQYEYETDFQADVTEDHIVIQMPQKNDLTYYLYTMDFLSVGENEEAVVFYNQPTGVEDYNKMCWEQEDEKYVLVDGIPYDGRYHDVSKIYIGKEAKRLIKKMKL